MVDLDWKSGLVKGVKLKAFIRFIPDYTLEVQPPFFISLVSEFHHHFSRGLSSAKMNHQFENGGWLKDSNRKPSRSEAITTIIPWFVSVVNGPMVIVGPQMAMKTAYGVILTTYYTWHDPPSALPKT